MKLSKVVNEVVKHAEASRRYWEKELPKRHPDYPIINPGEISPPPPLEEAKLEKLLQTLPEEMVYQLALVVGIGRGEFGTNELTKHIEQIKARIGRTEWAIAQLVDDASLAANLSDGLDALKNAGISLDRMIGDSATARK